MFVVSFKIQEDMTAGTLLVLDCSYRYMKYYSKNLNF